MKVTSESVGTREVTLTIEPDAESINKAMLKAAREISRVRPVPGYRPGKAPYAMVERLMGKETILNEALHDMAPTLYRQALEEAKVEPYEQGQLEIESQDPLVLKVSVPLAPVVTLSDYQSLTIEPEPGVAISEAQIDEQVERIRRQHATSEPVERPAQMGDQIVATVKGTADGEEVLNQENVTLDLSDQLPPPGFAEAVVGMSANETRTFSLTYPEDYEDTNLAGKNVEFAVTVTTVRQVTLPEVNDDLAKTAGDYDTVTAMREGLAENLKRRVEYEAREREANRAIDALVALATVEYPKAALDHEVEHTVENQKARLQQIGFAFDNYLRMIGKTEAELREEARPEAEKRLIRRLVLTEYARAEELKVEGSELNAEVAAIAAAYGDRSQDVLNRLRDSGAVFSIYADLLTRKAVRRLVAKTTGREEEADETAEAAAPAEGEAEQPAEGEAVPEEPGEQPAE